MENPTLDFLFHFALGALAFTCGVLVRYKSINRFTARTYWLIAFWFVSMPIVMFLALIVGGYEDADDYFKSFLGIAD